jgi:hypothetical protein
VQAKNDCNTSGSLRWMGLSKPAGPAAVFGSCFGIAVDEELKN